MSSDWIDKLIGKEAQRSLAKTALATVGVFFLLGVLVGKCVC